MGGLGEAAGHEGDHGPDDHGFMAGRGRGGEAFVVAGGPAVLADPGEGALDDHAAGQDLEAGDAVAEREGFIDNRAAAADRREPG
jgi:hypothetical protein